MKRLFRTKVFTTILLLAVISTQVTEVLAYDKYKPIISILGKTYEVDILESQKEAHSSMLSSLEGKYRGASTRPFDIQELNILSDGTADVVTKNSTGVVSSKRHICYAIDIDIYTEVCETLNLTTTKYYLSLKELKSRGYLTIVQLNKSTTFLAKGGDLVQVDERDGSLGYVLKKSWWPF